LFGFFFEDVEEAIFSLLWLFFLFIHKRYK
jgi:hypothetical protein